VEFLLLALGVFGLAAIGGGMAGVFDHKERIRRILKGARTVAIREVRDGQVAKVSGRVKSSGEPLRAPLTGRPCVYWEVEVTQWQGTRALTKRRVHDQRDFVVDDGTGRALVVVERVAVSAKIDVRWGQHDLADDRLAELLRLLGVDGIAGQVTYSEAVIAVGEEVAASGRGAWESDPDPGIAAGYRDRPLRLALRAGPRELVVVMGSEKEPRWLG